MEESAERLLVSSRISGIKDTFVQFSQRDNAEGQAPGGQFFQLPCDLLFLTQVINDSVGVNQILHSLGSGRADSSRSS